MAKALLVAFHCCPGMGSEAGIGWNFALGLSRRHDVLLLTNTEFREQINAYLATNPDCRLRVRYCDVPLPRNIMYRSYPTANIYYYAWQLRVALLARTLHKQYKYDLVHHVNWGRYWMLSGAAFTRAPFIWGPIGAAESPPRAFLSGMSLRGKISELSRDFLRRLFELDPGTRWTARTAHHVIAATHETEKRLRSWGVKNISVISSVGIDREDLPPNPPPSPPFDYACISIGRLLNWKGFHQGLAAFASCAPPGTRYAIVGEGPELARLRNEARRMGIADRVDFIGQVPRSECLKILANSAVLLHPSLHDSGGFVLVEAMALGKPVICLDIGGPAVIVDENSGFKIPCSDPVDALRRITQALNVLLTDPVTYHRLSRGATARGQGEFLWSRKMDQVDAIYSRVLARNGKGITAGLAENGANPNSRSNGHHSSSDPRIGSTDVPAPPGESRTKSH